MNDLVSVIMPTYNRGYIIKMAIDSILNQTYRNIEFIIVDDNSQDDTKEIVNSYKDDRIKYIYLESKSGANYARNIGIKNSNGNYITFQDSDDFSYENRIEEELKYLKENDYDLVFSSFRKVGKHNSVTPNKKVSDNDINKVLLTKNIITTQVLLGKKELFINETFDNELSRFQDWDLVIRLSKKYKCSHLDKVLLDMYVQNDSITKSNVKGYVSLESILKKYWNDFFNKQKCRLYFRIGIFKMLENMDATNDFKEGLKYSKNIEYLLMYFLYKIKLLKFVYKKLKK